MISIVSSFTILLAYELSRGSIPAEAHPIERIRLNHNTKESNRKQSRSQDKRIKEIQLYQSEIDLGQKKSEFERSNDWD